MPGPPRTRARKILRWAAVVGIAYAGAACLFAAAHRSFLYPAPSRPLPAEVQGAEVLRFEAGGLARAALFVGAANGDHTTIVHFHGNGETVFDDVALARDMAARGVGFCAAEYPGYGLLADQKPSEDAIYRAAEDVLVHLYAMGVPRDRVVLMGFSLGTGVAAEMAARGHGRKLLLFAPYTSITDVLASYAPLLPVTLLARDKFDTFGKVSAIRQDVMLVHGREDGVVPFAMGERLAAAFVGSRFVPVDDAGHGDLFLAAGGALLDDVVAFANR